MLDVLIDSRVPFKWLLAVMTMSCGALAGTVSLGIYIGARDANASSEYRRIDRLETDVGLIVTVDRRLARIEGALGVKVPVEDRIPALEGQ